MRAPRPGDLTFQTCCSTRRGLPIQTASIFLRSDVGESLLATQLVFCFYLSNTASLDLPLDAGASSPARQPYLSNLLLNEAYPSDTAIPKPVRRRREPPGQTALPFQPTARPGLPVRHGDSETSRTLARASGTDNFPFPSCGRQGLPNHAAG